MRNVGEQVILRVPTSRSVSVDTTTALSITAEDVPPLSSTDTLYPVFAHVVYRKTQEETYDEGGRVTNSHISLELLAAYAPLGVKATEVQTTDGTRYRVASRNWSDGRERFVLECDAVEIAQN